jgi:hypothetical protein
MSGTRSPWGPAAIAYLIYRRAVRKTQRPFPNPARTWLVRLLLVMFSAPLAAPILWHAFRAMPMSLVVFLGSVITFRIVRRHIRR